MEKTLKKNGKIIDSDFYEIDNHNIGNIRLISDYDDSKIYNNMIFFSFNGKLVIVSFNCTLDLQDEWMDVGKFIIDSIFFTE